MSWMGASRAIRSIVSGVRKPRNFGWERQGLAQDPRVAARPDEVRAGLEVPRLGERGEGVQHHLARRPQLAVALVGARPLGHEPVKRRGTEDADERERREQGRDVPAARAEEPPRAEPEQEPAARREGQGPPPPQPENAEGHPHRDAEDEGQLGDGPARRAADKVPLEQVVRHGRVNLHAGQERAERRGDRVAEPEGGHAYEDDPAPERAGGHPVLQHVDGGEAREGPRRAPEAHEHAPVGVEEDLAVLEPQNGPAPHSVGQPESPRRDAGSNGRDGREREARVHLTTELDDLGHAPKDPICVRRRVHEAGGGGRHPERVEAAQDPRRPRHLRQAAPRSGAPEPDRARMAGTVDGAVEREGVADHEGPAPERGRKGRVPDRERGQLARRLPCFAGRVTARIGLREEDVQTDGRRPEGANPVQEAGDPVAGPRPAPGLGQAALVDLDEGHAARRRAERGRGEEPVVHRQVGPGDERRTQEVEPGDHARERQARGEEPEGRRPTARRSAEDHDCSIVPQPRTIDPEPGGAVP